METKKKMITTSSNEVELEKEEVELVEKIVIEWNKLVSEHENTTIRFALMCKQVLEKYPENKKITIIKTVMNHPDLKRTVSKDRIWQGIRLVERRPDIIDYDRRLRNGNVSDIPTSKVPYLKKDGSVFYEFYFELEKHAISDNTKRTIELEAKEKGYTVVQLKEHIRDYKDEAHHPGSFETRRNEKYELIKVIIAICRELDVDLLRQVKDTMEKYRDARREERKLRDQSARDDMKIAKKMEFVAPTSEEEETEEEE